MMFYMLISLKANTLDLKCDERSLTVQNLFLDSSWRSLNPFAIINIRQGEEGDD